MSEEIFSGLYDKLNRYAKDGRIPMHMPGHKRECGVFTVDKPYMTDITEIDGFDDYHDPEDIILKSMKHAAEIYGTKKTYYLVNGSTCGILTAISAAVRRNGKIIVARNCHKSVYHAIELRGLFPVYIYPEIEASMLINGVINAEDVEKLLCGNEDAQAVIITSPTYEGVVSDIEKIAQRVHAHGKILIVDEAHGAHFRYSDRFPVSAVNLGADIVIQSLHKTLPSYTQTALLHVCTDRVEEAEIRKYLGIYQSSSPSYVFMAGMEKCIDYVSGDDGMRAMREYTDNLSELRKKLSGTEGICILEKNSRMYDYDISKLVISAYGILTGNQISGILRDKYNIEPEMTADDYVILMTSMCDRKEWYNIICEAAEDIGKTALKSNIDGMLHNEQSVQKCNGTTTGMDDEGSKRTLTDNKSQHTSEPLRYAMVSEYAEESAKYVRSCVRMKPQEAAECVSEAVEVSQCRGRICTQMVYAYPPGIPVLAPGEEITDEVYSVIERHRRYGVRLKGINISDNGKEVILCIK